MRAFLIALILCIFFSGTAQAQSAGSVYDRVIDSGVLRCGYIVWGDQLKLDPNTGEMSGLTYDLTNAIGRELGLKIEWTEETGWGSFHEGLNSGRYDMMCGLVWQSGPRAKAALLTKPVTFTPMHIFVREDDNRFNDSLESLNTPGTVIAVIDGDPSQDIRTRRFSRTKELALPSMTDSGSYFLTVATKKADAAIGDIAIVERYNKNANAKLKPAADGRPVRMIADVYAVKNGEERLKYLIDTAIDIVNISGEGPDIVAPYAPTFLPVAPIYLPPEDVAKP